MAVGTTKNFLKMKKSKKSRDEYFEEERKDSFKDIRKKHRDKSLYRLWKDEKNDQ